MKSRKLLLCFVCVILAGSLLSCTKKSPAKEAVTSVETRIYEDDVGRQVELPPKITRIIPAGPLAQIILYSIDPDMFTGLTNKWSDSAKEFIPQKYRDLPYFGQLYGGVSLNVEELAFSEPDCIIDIGEIKKTTVEDLDTLQKQTGIPSVYVVTSLQDMGKTYRVLGELLGKQERCEELAQFCETTYQRTMEIMEKVGDKKVRSLFVVGEQGLNVLAKNSYHAELIDMLTDNVAVVDNPLSKGLGNEVTMEQIALWNPDFVIFDAGSIYRDVAKMASWNEIAGIVAGRYVEVPSAPHNWMGMPPSVQRFLGMIWLTAVLYPDYCDYDVQEEICQYYKLFYGCELTESQYASLTEFAFCQ